MIVLTCVFINIIVDFYIYRTLKVRTKSPIYRKVHIYTSILLLVYIIVGVSLPRRTGSDASLLNIMWILYSYFSIYFPKWIYVVLDIIASIPKIWKLSRLKIVSNSGLVFAVSTFALMWWGALINRYNINITETDIELSELPDNFEGYRIAHFSDLHAGSFHTDTAFISKIVNTINEQDVDAIVFTGDIVNRQSDELIPFVDILSRLQAHDGVFSIMGNHDYGDYFNWESESAKAENINTLKHLQKQMGWKLLLNESHVIRHDNDSIVIIGVENWGDPPFSVYGNLKKSYPEISDSAIKILLTHNPAHWVAEVSENDSTNIALSLAGHTHAMQLSIFGFSPAVWRYDTWGGLYRNSSCNKYLYVNIGVGTVGIPTRIGATPEVSIITLHKKK